MGDTRLSLFLGFFGHFMAFSGLKMADCEEQRGRPYTGRANMAYPILAILRVTALPVGENLGEIGLKCGNTIGNTPLLPVLPRYRTSTTTWAFFEGEYHFRMAVVYTLLQSVFLSKCIHESFDG